MWLFMTTILFADYIYAHVCEWRIIVNCLARNDISVIDLSYSYWIGLIKFGPVSSDATTNLSELRLLLVSFEFWIYSGIRPRTFSLLFYLTWKVTNSKMSEPWIISTRWPKLNLSNSLVLTNMDDHPWCLLWSAKEIKTFTIVYSNLVKGRD